MIQLVKGSLKRVAQKSERDRKSVTKMRRNVPILATLTTFTAQPDQLSLLRTSSVRTAGEAFRTRKVVITINI